MKQRFFNMYLTATISVALVLFLVGLECVFLLSAHQLIQRVKQNVAITVILSDDISAEQDSLLGTFLAGAPYVYECRYISKQEALEEHIRTLGEDPEKFLGYNPLSDSYEVKLKAEYAQQDSILPIEDYLVQIPGVQKVTHPQEVVSMLDMHMGEVSLALIAVAVLLLFISWALIANTVRLHVYSKRFTINTMRLVGATPWVIRSPFIKRNLRLGFEAGVVALALLALALYYVKERLGVWLFDLTWQNIVVVVAVVLIGGEIVTCLASLVATSRYIRMKTDKMYEI